MSPFEHFHAQALNRGIPEPSATSFAEYVTYGRPVGGFGQAVLCNQLVEAYFKADMVNRARLGCFAEFLLHDAPADCWGSKEKIVAWEGVKDLYAIG